MKSKIIGILFSLVISAMIFFDEGNVHQFAVSVSAVLNFFGFIVLFVAPQDVLHQSKRMWWLGLPSMFVSVVVLVLTDHPNLACFTFFVQLLLCVRVVTSKPKEEVL